MKIDEGALDFIGFKTLDIIIFSWNSVVIYDLNAIFADMIMFMMFGLDFISSTLL
jgi:hypothetical protein